MARLEQLGTPKCGILLTAESSSPSLRQLFMLPGRMYLALKYWEGAKFSHLENTGERIYVGRWTETDPVEGGWQREWGLDSSQMSDLGFIRL